MTDYSQPNKPMTWNDLADFYKEKTGRIARVRPLDEIYEWGKKQPEIIETEEGLVRK